MRSVAFVVLALATSLFAQPTTAPTTVPATRPARSEPVRLVNQDIRDVTTEIWKVLTLGHPADTNAALREVVAEERALMIKKHVATLPGKRGPLEFNVVNVTAPDGAAGLWRVSGTFDCVLTETLTPEAREEIAKIRKQTEDRLDAYYKSQRPAPKPRRSMPVGYQSSDDDRARQIRLHGQQQIEAVKARCRRVSRNTVEIGVPQQDAARWKIGQLVVLPVQIEVAKPSFARPQPARSSRQDAAKSDQDDLMMMLQADAGAAAELNCSFQIQASRVDR